MNHSLVIVLSSMVLGLLNFALSLFMNHFFPFAALGAGCLLVEMIPTKWYDPDYASNLPIGVHQ